MLKKLLNLHQIGKKLTIYYKNYLEGITYDITGKMREIIESESPFRCGETRVTDYGFSYELVDERGRGSGIELHENFNEGVALVYTLGAYEINKSFGFSEVDAMDVITTVPIAINRLLRFSFNNLKTAFGCVTVVIYYKTKMPQMKEKIERLIVG